MVLPSQKLTGFCDRCKPGFHRHRRSRGSEAQVSNSALDAGADDLSRRGKPLHSVGALQFALQLLGHLAETGLPIQFKGGLSLLLRLNPLLADECSTPRRGPYSSRKDRSCFSTSRCSSGPSLPMVFTTSVFLS